MYDIILAFTTALALSYLSLPSVIKISKVRQLMTPPEARSSHTEETPALGGIGIFIGAIFSLVLWTPFEDFGGLQYILCSIIIMFFVGLRDDLLAISPRQKFAGQVVAAFILVVKSDIKITGFHGVFGIGDVPEFFAILLTVFAIVLIVNAYNLIDGINGLCGSITVFTCVTMGFWFYLNQEMALALTAAATAGGTVGFLKYNMSGKIFMGDTGSLLVGVVAAVLFIEFIEMNADLNQEVAYRMDSGVAVGIAIILYPLLDTLRVFAVRILILRKSPFQPDKHHIHHYLLAAGRSHLQATGIIVLLSVLFVALTIQLGFLGNTYLILLLIFIGIVGSTLLFFARRPTNGSDETSTTPNAS